MIKPLKEVAKEQIEKYVTSATDSTPLFDGIDILHITDPDGNWIRFDWFLDNLERAYSEMLDAHYKHLYDEDSKDEDNG